MSPMIDTQKLQTGLATLEVLEQELRGDVSVLAHFVENACDYCRDRNASAVEFAVTMAQMRVTIVQGRVVDMFTLIQDLKQHVLAPRGDAATTSA